jgi:hypothetical protein
MGVEAGGRPVVSGGSSEERRQAAAPAIVDTKDGWDVNAVLGKVGVKPRPGEKTEWNTKHLTSRLGVDAMCAAAAGGLVAPVITIIDRAIVENASGKRPMMESFKASLGKLLLQPHHFLVSRPFRLIFMLYGGTYLTANTLDTFKSTVSTKPASSTTSGLEKFAATSAANLSLCLYKDSQFTKMFGTVSPRPVPPISYALFAARDSLTIFASFNLPSIIAPSLPMGEAAEKLVSRASAAQFLAPAGIQLISTPLHLMGLDFYNRNGGAPLSDRMSKVRVDWLKSSLARMCRIVPAFGLGGIINNGMRKRFMWELE